MSKVTTGPGRRLRVMVAGIAVVAALVLAACGGAGSGGGTSNGNSITVALAVPKPPNLAQFTKQTGIKVNWVQLGWDDLQTKITAAEEAHSYFADVTDVDWSRVGQYNHLHWFQNLKSDIPVNSWRSDMPSFDAFSIGKDVVGVPMDSSFMVTTVNKKMLSEAGITTMPTTIDEFTQDMKTVQSKGVDAHPLGIPLAAAEGLSTYWYETTGAFGGHVLNSNQSPAFTSPSSPGYKAFEWIVDAYKSGLVPAANLNKTDTDEMTGQMAEGQLAGIFSDYSGNVNSIYDSPQNSKVVDQVTYIKTPTSGGPSLNLTNPDGVGIPVSAHNAKAAMTFIKWLTSTTQQAPWAGSAGPKESWQGIAMPARTSALQKVVKTGQAAGGGEELSILQHSVRPVFPEGAPAWYADFSNAVYTNLHQAAAGQESVPAAISAIASKTKSLRSSG